MAPHFDIHPARACCALLCIVNTLAASVHRVSSTQLQPQANTMQSASRSAKLREAHFSDYPQIEALESRYGLEPRSQDEWAQLWINNPVVRELRPDWPIGWVLENAEGRIVGSI